MDAATRRHYWVWHDERQSKIEQQLATTIHALRPDLLLGWQGRFHPGASLRPSDGVDFLVGAESTGFAPLADMQARIYEGEVKIKVDSDVSSLIGGVSLTLAVDPPGAIHTMSLVSTQDTHRTRRTLSLPSFTESVASP